MKLDKILKIFFGFLATSLLAYALLPSASITFLLKAIALSLALTILIALFYYEIRGARAGDKVMVYGNNIFPFIGKEGILLENAKLGQEVKVALNDGGEVTGILESYEDLFYPHKIRILYEERKI